MRTGKPVRTGFHFFITLMISCVLIAAIGSAVVHASPPARPLLQPNTWFALPNTGLDLRSDALLMVGTDLYVGGMFKQTADGAVTNLNAIARLDTAANTWHALGNNGLTDSVLPLPQVRCLARVGNYLYMGGFFDETADLTLTGLDGNVRYNLTTNAFQALPNGGLNGEVFSMAVVGSDIYMGGTFSQTIDGTVVNLNNIARYNTVTGTWSALTHDGLDDGVNDLKVIGNNLYVVGGITQTFDGAVTGLNEIARYNLLTNTWSALAHNGLSGAALVLEGIGDTLYVGGYLDNTSDLAVPGLNHIARYNTATNQWSALAHQGINSGGHVSALVAAGHDLYVGGETMNATHDGAVTGLNDIARYDTLANIWHALPNNGFRLPPDDQIWDLLPAGGNLYVSGRFTQTNDGLVTNLNNIARLGGDLPPQVVDTSANGSMSGSITKIKIKFNKDVVDPAGNADANDVTNPLNYLLLQAGPNAGYDTVDCNTGLAGDDVSISVDSASYASPSFTSTISVNGGTPLPLGVYRGLVCGTTSIEDEYGLKLGGGVDYVYDFELVAASHGAASAGGALPATGFAPGVITQLPVQPLAKRYVSSNNLSLQIPSLAIDLPIVGVPQSAGGWDVSWLNRQAGYLYGTAFPTWTGNTAITAHVWDANNKPGPFINLKNLSYGDEINIHAWGQRYVYAVKENYLVSPGDQSPLAYQNANMVTLLTCELYNARLDEYRFRRVVQAVLVSVKSE